MIHPSLSELKGHYLRLLKTYGKTFRLSTLSEQNQPPTTHILIIFDCPFIKSTLLRSLKFIPKSVNELDHHHFRSSNSAVLEKREPGRMVLDDIPKII